MWIDNGSCCGTPSTPEGREPRWGGQDDRVCNQRLMAWLAQRVHDKPLLVLIGWMLKPRS